MTGKAARSSRTFNSEDAVRAIRDLLDGLAVSPDAGGGAPAPGLPLPLERLDRNLKRVRLRAGNDLPGRFWNGVYDAPVAASAGERGRGAAERVRFPLYWIRSPAAASAEFFLRVAYELHARCGISDFVVADAGHADRAAEIVFGLLNEIQVAATENRPAGAGVGTMDRTGGCALLEPPHPGFPSVWVTSLGAEAGEEGTDEPQQGEEPGERVVSAGIRARRPIVIIDAADHPTERQLAEAGAFEPLAVIAIGAGRPERFNFVGDFDLAEPGIRSRVTSGGQSPLFRIRNSRRVRETPPPVSLIFRLVTLLAVVGLIVEPPLVVLALARRGAIARTWGEQASARRGVLIGVYQAIGGNNPEPLWVRYFSGREGEVISDGAIVAAIPESYLERMKQGDQSLLIRVSGRLQNRNPGPQAFRIQGNVGAALYLNGSEVVDLPAYDNLAVRSTDSPERRLVAGDYHLLLEIRRLNTAPKFVVSMLRDSRPAGALWISAFHADPIPGGTSQ